MREWSRKLGGVKVKENIGNKNEKELLLSEGGEAI